MGTAWDLQIAALIAILSLWSMLTRIPRFDCT